MDATENNVIKLAVWNGSLYEGKMSVTFDYCSITVADRGPAASDPGTGANDTGIIFGGEGIKASTKTSANAIQSDDNTYFYFLYFSKSTLNLARVDKDMDTDNSSGDDWCGTIKDSADNSNLKYDLNASSAPQEYKDMWAAAKTSDKIEVTLAWSAAGAVLVSILGAVIVSSKKRNVA